VAFSFDQRKELLAVTASRRKEVIKAATEYMARTGLNESDFARRLRTRGGSSYSRSTLNLFLNERYHVVSADDSQICQSVVDFIAAHPIAAQAIAGGKKLYETANVRLIRRYFYEALDKGRAYLLRGAPGTQKSEVISHLVAELNQSEIRKNGHGRRAFPVYCSEGIRPTQLMKEVAIAASSSSMGDTRRIFRNLRFDLSGRRALFIFDESQHLNISCLETIRELLDLPPHAGLLFLGSHEIENTFNRLDMEQWGDRVRQAIELPGIQEEEAAQIITAELGEYPEDKIRKLIKQCYGTDLRKGREVQYISARKLFFAIDAIKERRAAKGANA
jgi:DNA transposition AAA+ family ATPase